MDTIDKAAQDVFFRELGALLRQPGTLYVFGGTSLICLSMPDRLTNDLDAYSATDTDLGAQLKLLAQRYGWKVDDLDVADISETPSELARPPQLYGQFDNLTVMILDPNLTAVGKLDRAGRDDITDLTWMFDNGLLDHEVLERMIAGARGMDDKAKSTQLYNRITGRSMRVPQVVSPAAAKPRKRRWWWPW